MFTEHWDTMRFTTSPFVKPMAFSEESVSQHPASTATGNTSGLSTKRGFIPTSLNSVATTNSQNPQILCNAGSSHFDMAHRYCLKQPAALLLVRIAKHSRESGQWGFYTNSILETLTDNAASRSQFPPWSLQEEVSHHHLATTPHIQYVLTELQTPI